MPRRLKQFILLAGDIGLLYLSLWLALWSRYLGGLAPGVFNEHIPVFTFVFFLWLIVFFILGLYSLSSIWNVYRALRGFIGAMVVNTFLAIIFFYFVPYFGITPKTILFLQLGFFTVLFPLWRIAYGRILRTVGATNNLVIVGSKPAPLELARTILHSPELGYNLFAICNLNGKAVPGWVQKGGVLVGRNLTQLRKIIKEGEIDAVIVSNELYPKIFGSLYRNIPVGADFYNLATFWEELNRSIPISEANEIWFLDNLRGVRKGLYEVRKRGLDVVFFGLFRFLLPSFVAFYRSGNRIERFRSDFLSPESSRKGWEGFQNRQV